MGYLKPRKLCNWALEPLVQTYSHPAEGFLTLMNSCFHCFVATFHSSATLCILFNSLFKTPMTWTTHSQSCAKCSANLCHLLCTPICWVGIRNEHISPMSQARPWRGWAMVQVPQWGSNRARIGPRGQTLRLTTLLKYSECSNDLSRTWLFKQKMAEESKNRKQRAY